MLEREIWCADHAAKLGEAGHDLVVRETARHEWE